MADPQDPFAQMDDIFGTGPSGFGTQFGAASKVEKGVPWEAKVIDGVYYVPLSQVADLLKENDVLPKVRKGIEARVQAQKDRKDLGIT